MNKDVFNQLVNLYHENKLSHAYLFETDNIDKCYSDLIGVIKEINCNNKYSKTCDKCTLCHLIDENLLPSFITIEPSGKNITKDDIDNLKKAFVMKPVYTDNNIYVIKECEKMNDTAYNKMLKFLEEPSENIIGFFISKDISNVASTILSRLEVIKHYYNDSIEINNSIEKIVEEYFNLIKEDKNEAFWYNNNVILKNLEQREDYVYLFNSLLTKFNNLKMYKISKLIAKYLDELNYNVNVSLLLDSFVLEVGDLIEY